jgi:hypothetical protein
MTNRGWKTSKMTVIALACIGTLTLTGAARGWSVAADGHRRAEESEAHHSYHHQQLANKDAIVESQRLIYMERFRRLEALVREREQEIAALRGCLLIRSAMQGEEQQEPAPSSR